jgi:polyisoprenyl-phosphate glycosyltransferase
MSDPIPPTLLLSVVSPAYLNAATLPELVRRIAAAATRVGRFEILIVDDASPDATRETLERLVVEEPALAALGLARNVGQQRAIRAGLARCRGRRVVVLDADLQDPPEAIPDLVAALADSPAVFAGRRGAYQAWTRRVSSLTFKRLQAALAAVPRDAGLYFGARAEVAAALVAYPAPDPALIPLLGALVPHAPVVPVARTARPVGRSAYRGTMRWRAGLRALRFALHLRRHPPDPGLRAARPGASEAIAYRLGWLPGEAESS